MVAVVARLFWQLRCALVAVAIVDRWPLICREVKTRVNVWTVHQDKKSGRCGEVAFANKESCSGLFQQ